MKVLELQRIKQVYEVQLMPLVELPLSDVLCRRDERRGVESAGDVTVLVRGLTLTLNWTLTLTLTPTPTRSSCRT